MALTKPNLSQINTSIVSLGDAMLTLNKDATSASSDIGLVLNRGTGSNVTVFWNETTDRFEFAYTANSGVSVGNITVSSRANVIASGVFADSFYYSNGAAFVGGGGGGQADKIQADASNVTVTTNYVNVAINSTNVASFSSQGFTVSGNIYLLGSSLAAIYGGTGQTSYTAGDLLYATSSTTLAKLPAGGANQVLQIHANAVPYWDNIDGGTY